MAEMSNYLENALLNGTFLTMTVQVQKYLVAHTLELRYLLQLLQAHLVKY